MLAVLTVLIMLAVAYAYLREGLFTAFAMLFNVFFSGLVAFNFWEPLADLLDPMLAGSFLQGFEDAFCLAALFSISLGLLRTATNAMASAQISFSLPIQRAGSAIVGAMTGYLTSGILVCILQTLPWHENFMFFDPTYQGASMRSLLPADRVWLGMMHRAGAYAFANNEDNRYPNARYGDYDKYYTFDKNGSFTFRYTFYRRYGDKREIIPYRHELDEEIRGPRN